MPGRNKDSLEATPVWLKCGGHLCVSHWNRTSSSGCFTGKFLSITASIKLKIAVFAPIPSASVNTATAVNPGFFDSIRQPKRVSCQSEYIQSSCRQSNEG